MPASYSQVYSRQKKDQAAASTANYRGFQINETPTGCMFEYGGKTYDFANLDEATACIDFMYADAARRVLSM